MDEVARDKGITTTQLALAWLMAQGPDIIPIPSSKSREHLEENLKAVEVEITVRGPAPARRNPSLRRRRRKPDAGHEAGERVVFQRSLPARAMANCSAARPA